MGELSFRRATQGDVVGIRALLGDDKLGQTREDMSEEGMQKYLTAFEAIERSTDNELWVAVEVGKEVIEDVSQKANEAKAEILGTWQVTYIPYLSRGGNVRCLIEAVRTKSDRRGEGIGYKMMAFALDQARQKGCQLAQLTTDKTRQDAHRFYQKLGFVATHEGMKLQL